MPRAIAFITLSALLASGLVGSDRTMANGGAALQAGAVPPTAPFPAGAQCKEYARFASDPAGLWRAGSGTLISPKHLLTAAHLVFRAKRGGLAKEVKVIPSLDGEKKPFGEGSSVRLRVLTGWSTDADPAMDIALVTLDQEIGRKAGWLEYGDVPGLEVATAQLCDYPGDRDKGLRAQLLTGAITGVT